MTEATMDETSAAAEEEQRSGGQRMEDNLRWFGDFIFRPFLWFFEKLRISPNLITCFGIALGIGAGYFLAVGNVPLAAVLFATSGVLDLVDGYVAIKMNKVTAFGSFLDSFSDRISDAAVYLGLTVYYMRLGEGIYVGLALVLLVCSFLVSYIRAKAESMGVEGKGGLMARAPRMLAIGAGLFFNGLSPWVLRIVLIVVTVMIVETLFERFIVVWKALDA
jgi:CDP-diacylglycerol---glycerol-3-phosphate 3-phosphatidyltransferase